MSVPWVDLPEGVAFRCPSPNAEFSTCNFLMKDGRVLTLKTDKILPMTDVKFLDAKIQTMEEYRKED